MDLLFRESTTPEQRLVYDAVKRNDEQSLKALLAKGVNPNFRDPQYDWLINDGIGTWNPSIVTDLLQAGVDPNRLDCQGMPPLWYLEGLVGPPEPDDEQLVRIATALVDSRAKLTAKGSERWNGLLLVRATERGHLKFLAWLLDHGVPIDATAGGSTALMAAIGANQPAIAKYLLEHGASTHAEASGPTPLLIAIARGNLDLVKLLLDHGADPNEVRIYGTPLSDALGRQSQASLAHDPEQRRYDAIVDLLRHAGAVKTLNNGM
jgi:ankyrin repeat protein